MAIEFTEEQKKVIEARGSTLLVSAAAGSGKTAVLTQRIIGLIKDPKAPMDIDRMLVVTFTNAAAAQMREKIEKAIGEALLEDPENAHLQRQKTLIHNARICTIDSFCSYVLRDCFGDIGIDPAFRIGDAGELKLLENEALDQVFEDLLSRGDEEFLYTINALSARGDEGELAEVVRSLYHSIGAHPFPEEWLLNALSDYEGESGRADEFRLRDVRQTLEACIQGCRDAISICERPEGPYMYIDAMESDREAFAGVLAMMDKGDIGDALAAISYKRLSPKKDPAVSEGLKGTVKEIREASKDAVKELIKRYYGFDNDTRSADIRGGVPLIRTICNTTLAFSQKLYELKSDKKIIGFSDCEHMCLQILLEKDEERGIYVPTEAAGYLRDYYSCIMIDEYQDSNMVQEYILKSIAGDELGDYNRFMVGDVKQSIYRFRQARPELFMEKYGSYTVDEGAPERKIILSKNFRSRHNVTDFVNHIFSRLMIPQVGGVAYDNDATLRPGLPYPEGEGFDPEVLVLNAGSLSGSAGREAECRLIASRIRGMVGKSPVTGEDGNLRPATYRDIAILFRNPSKWVGTLLDVLKEYDIPAYAVSTKGYFAAVEVRTVMNMISIIENPLQDIPLYGVMTSRLLPPDIPPFDEEELALIRGGDRNKCRYLYEAVRMMAWEDGDEICRLAGKCSAFISYLNRYRDMAPATSVRDIIASLLEETDFLNLNCVLPTGDAKAANIALLLEKAAAYEKNGSRGVFSFIRYIEQLEKQEIDNGEAAEFDENADVVRIMSIHKSKGLEFPICIVGGLGSRFVTEDSKGTVLWDADLGIGCDYVDVERRVKRSTVRKNAIVRKLKLDMWGEELRVLYVALTRAREKLILTMRVNKPEEYLQLTDMIPNYNSILGASGFYGMLRGVIPPELMWVVEPSDIELAGALTKSGLLEKRQWIEEVAAGEVRVPEAFDYVYHRKDLEGLFTKTTVSELKAAHLQDEIAGAGSLFDISGDWGVSREEAYVPPFMACGEKITGARRGSAYHRLMELFDMQGLYENSVSPDFYDYIGQSIKAYINAGLISQQDAELVPVEKLQRFGCTEVARRMGEASGRGDLYREHPFIMGIGADELGKGYPREETVLIQGIIDVWWEEADGLVILDYKTDRVKSGSDLTDRYRLQLDYYQEALERITHMRVKEKILYSFYLDEVVVIS